MHNVTSLQALEREYLARRAALEAQLLEYQKKYHKDMLELYDWYQAQIRLLSPIEKKDKAIPTEIFGVPLVESDVIPETVGKPITLSKIIPITLEPDGNGVFVVKVANPADKALLDSQIPSTDENAAKPPSDAK